MRCHRLGGIGCLCASVSADARKRDVLGDVTVDKDVPGTCTREDGFGHTRVGSSDPEKLAEGRERAGGDVPVQSAGRSRPRS